MIDLEELKRLRADFPEINLSNFDVDDVAALNGWGIEVTLILPAILAKLEAAQRLRDAAEPFCKIAEGTMGRIPTERLSGANYHELWKSVAAFDKEQS